MRKAAPGQDDGDLNLGSVQLCVVHLGDGALGVVNLFVEDVCYAAVDID